MLKWAVHSVATSVGFMFSDGTFIKTFVILDAIRL